MTNRQLLALIAGQLMAARIAAGADSYHEELAVADAESVLLEAGLKPGPTDAELERLIGPARTLSSLGQDTTAGVLRPPYVPDPRD